MKKYAGVTAMLSVTWNLYQISQAKVDSSLSRKASLELMKVG